MKKTDAAKGLACVMNLPDNPKAVELAKNLLDLLRADDLKQHTVYQELDREVDGMLKQAQNRVA